jgi:hypothetical protein
MEGAMNETILFLIIGGSIGWVVWTVRDHKKALKEVALNEAWQTILDDPNYSERRRVEERKRVVQQARTYHRLHVLPLQ